MKIVTRSFLTFAIVATCLAPQGLSQHRSQFAPRPGKRQGKAEDRSAPAITPEIQAALDRISADSLRGHLSFIASDLLEGRDTPSRGLDVAAEYIAAQFRRAGLEPAGDNGYFQTADWPVASQNPVGFSLELRKAHAVDIVPESQARWSTEVELNFSGLAVVKL